MEVSIIPSQGRTSAPNVVSVIGFNLFGGEARGGKARNCSFKFQMLQPWVSAGSDMSLCCNQVLTV